MRILFVAMPDSVHTARWINQVADQPWELHLFPAYPAAVHPQLRNTTFHPAPRSTQTARSFLRGCRNAMLAPARRLRALRQTVPAGDPPPVSAEAMLAQRERAQNLLEKLMPKRLRPAARLAALIEQLQPDIIHSLEIQHAGYLMLKTRERLSGPMPPWVVSNWGSDIYLFGRFASHIERIRAVMSQANYYCCECQRDVGLGRQFGFQDGGHLVIPGGGGFHLDEIQRFRQPGPVSRRRVIALKGYQGWAGRALVGLKALSLCGDALAGYEVHIYNASRDAAVRNAAQEFSRETGHAAHIVPHSSHETMLRLHGRARVSIGLSISDAASTSFLEALVMGSFPIQSHTACADEWVTDGEGGLLVPPEDPQAVAQAIRKALADDALVDRAAEINAVTVRQRLDFSALRQQAIALYEKILRQSQGG